ELNERPATAKNVWHQKPADDHHDSNAQRRSCVWHYAPQRLGVERPAATDVRMKSAPLPTGPLQRLVIWRRKPPWHPGTVVVVAVAKEAAQGGFFVKRDEEVSAGHD